MSAARTSRTVGRTIQLLGLSIVALLLAAVSGGAAAQAQHPPGDGGSIIPTIVQTANNQIVNSERNHEIGGENCNYYTTAMGRAGTGGICTHLGWMTEKWCADFATWVFRAGGAQINGLTAAAASGHDYGVIHHTWHTTGPKVGDLAVYASQHHIGIVTKIDGAQLTIVSGNTYRAGQSSGPIDAVARHYATVSDMWGFASPVA